LINPFYRNSFAFTSSFVYPILYAPGANLYSPNSQVHPTISAIAKYNVLYNFPGNPVPKIFLPIGFGINLALLKIFKIPALKSKVYSRMLTMVYYLAALLLNHLNAIIRKASYS
jgi:hypothetical protein